MIKFNKYGWLAVISIVAIFAAGGFLLLERYFKEVSAARQQKANFDLQAECATKAQDFFNYFLPNLKDRQREEFSNHYNLEVNKCFVFIKNGLGDGNDIFSEDLYDAVEKKQYASFAVGVPTWGKPLICDTLDKTCESRDEFDNFVKPYMNN